MKGRAWLFVGRCWLAVVKGDGQVERRLRVCTRGIGFAKVDLSHRCINSMICKKKKTLLYFYSHVTLGLRLADVASQAF